ncbi:MAG: hypothetical protein LBJ69_00535 [Holosporales bacterium]|jgi:hypothetical protein|nr:hypothetical protein [Holosporales bacterium]
MAVYKELLGHPAIQASGTGPKAVKAQAPTGLFLFTHQQWLINGAARLIYDICSTVPQPLCIEIAVRRIIQRQLEEIDGDTDIQQIRDCWRWRYTGATYTAPCHMYTVTIDSTTKRQQLCCATMEMNSYCLLGYADETSRLSNTTATLGVPPTNTSAMEIASYTNNPIADELTRFTVKELAYAGGITAVRRASDCLQDECLIMGLKYEGLTETMKDKLSIRHIVRSGVTDAATRAAYPIPYILYQRLQPPPTAEDDTPA